jgi:hypothetical protein
MVEDEYGVVNFTHFCLHVLATLDRYNEIGEADIKERILKISELPNKEQLSAISSYFISIVGTKKLIALVENFDTLLKGMNDDGASLRDLMHEYIFYP